MPFTLDWYIEDEVLFSYTYGDISLAEVEDYLTRLQQLMDSSPRAAVHVISDVGDITSPLSPKESLQIARQREAKEIGSWFVVLRERSMLVKMGIAMSTSLFKARTKSLDTLAEAEAFFKRVDNHLSWEKANRSILPDHWKS